jgi:hypothetical protein
MADHVGNEVGLMVLGHVRFVQGGDVLSGRASMHSARSLMEFFDPRRPNSDRHIRADDYAPGWTVEADEKKLMKERLSSIDQHLSHLSLSRSKQPRAAPERWDDTVRRLVSMARRLVDTADATGVQELATYVGRAEEMLARPR